MTYRVPTAEQADAWVRETVNIYEGAEGSLEEARFQVSSRPNPAEGSGLGCFVHVVPGASQREYGLVIVVNHSLFDGTGGKIVSGRFLTHLADVLRADGRAAGIAWGSEIENLLPGYEEVMADAEATADEKTRKETLDAVLGEIVRLAEVSICFLSMMGCCLHRASASAYRHVRSELCPARQAKAYTHSCRVARG